MPNYIYVFNIKVCWLGFPDERFYAFILFDIISLNNKKNYNVQL